MKNPTSPAGTFKIQRLTIQNFRAIAKMELNLNGQNAIIRGQNGSGKTSIVDAVKWLFQSRVQYEPLNSAAAPCSVELAFTNGLTFGRTARGGKSFFSVNGVSSNSTDFSFQVRNIFNANFTVLLAPLTFGELHFKEQRKILTDAFSADLSTAQAEQIILQARAKLKDLDRELIQIPARINELSLSRLEIDTAAVQAEINKLTAEIKKMQSAGDRAKIERELAELRGEYKHNEAELARLRREFANVKKALHGKCPLCGSKVPVENLDELNLKFADIGDGGKLLAQRQKDISQAAEQLKKTMPPPVDTAELEHLQDKLLKAKLLLAEAKRNAENQQRIEQLRAREKKLGELKTQYDRQIFQAEQQIRALMQQLEANINRNFKFGFFQMFKPYKVTEGVKETCEYFSTAGVPYSCLSTGEKLKASLDILNALQQAYQLQLPLFLDDAESYTSNSLVDLPNQIIKLTASEGINQLQVEVEK